MCNFKGAQATYLIFTPTELVQAMSEASAEHKACAVFYIVILSISR